MIGQKIQIIESPELTEWRLSHLAGHEGVIVEELIEKRKIKGAWVSLDIPDDGEKEWFIPLQSITPKRE